MSVNQNPLISYIPSAATINDVFYYPTRYYDADVAMQARPDSILASENASYFSFWPKIIALNETNAKIYITFAGVPPEDTIITLSAATLNAFPTYQITAKAEPGINEFYSTATTPTRTIAEVAQSFMYALNQNVSFAQRFYATQTGNTVIVVALAAGSKWNIDTHYYPTSTTAVTTTLTVDSGDYYQNQNKKDWAVWCDLYVNGRGDMGNTIDRNYAEYVTSFEFSYKRDNNYVVDCSGAVKNYLSTPTPAVDSATMTYLSGSTANYFLVFGQKYDEFLNNYRRKFLHGQTSVHWLFNSSLPFDNYNSLSSYTFNNSTVALSGNNRKSYLTNQPSSKQTYIFGKEYLSILYEDAATIPDQINLYFNVDVNYVDGTVDAGEFNIQTTDVLYSGGCWTANVSADQMFTDTTYNGKLIKSYTVRLYKFTLVGVADNDLLIGKEQEYVIAHDCESEGLQNIMWRNSLGGWDTFVFNGELSSDIDRKITLFNYVLPLNYQRNYTNYVSYQSVDSVDFEKTYEAHTGFIDKNHFDWLVEIFKSSDVRILENDEWKRIIIKKGDAKANTNEDLFKLSLTYVYALPENYIKN